MLEAEDETNKDQKSLKSYMSPKFAAVRKP